MARKAIKILFVTSILIIAILAIRLMIKEPNDSIVYKLYQEQNPSFFTKLFRYVPNDFKKNIRINVLENFNGSQLICAGEDYGFYYYRLYLITKDKEILNFTDDIVGLNLNYNFNLKSFNYYLKNKYPKLNYSISTAQLILFLNNPCKGQMSVVLRNSNDLDQVIKKHSLKKVDLKLKHLFPIRENNILIWDNKKGILKISYNLNSDFTLKDLKIYRIVKLGNEMNDL